jgi:hypothetical protein
MKITNKQRDYNKSIVNDDAEYKLLAFNAMLDKENRERHENDDDDEAAFSYDSFAMYYKKELKMDARRPARKMNPEHYK